MRLTNGAREGIFRRARDCSGLALPDGAKTTSVLQSVPVIEGKSIKVRKNRSSLVDKGIGY